MASCNEKNELINIEDSIICSAGFLNNNNDYLNNDSVTSLQSTILAGHLSGLEDEIENSRVSERRYAINSDNESEQFLSCGEDSNNPLNVNIDALTKRAAPKKSSNG